MNRFILLDSGVIGLLCSSPRLALVAACLGWFTRMEGAGATLVMPDLAIYETQRELLRIRASSKIARLKNLQRSLGPTPVTPEAWFKAAEFWAHVRQAGKPTAHPQALDGDAILAGVAATIGRPGDSVTIATTNVRHLSWFPGVDARRWETIA